MNIVARIKFSNKLRILYSAIGYYSYTKRRYAQAKKNEKIWRFTK